MKTYTTLDTLSAAWTILDEVGLAGLLTGRTMELKAEELMRKLLVERKLQEFLGAITHEDPEKAGELETGEAAELITAFFGSTAADLSKLAGLKTEVKETDPAMKPEKPAR
jgi:hypothetical protein